MLPSCMFPSHVPFNCRSAGGPVQGFPWVRSLKGNYGSNEEGVHAVENVVVLSSVRREMRSEVENLAGNGHKNRRLKGL